jgi:hypothetical protein
VRKPTDDSRHEHESNRASEVTCKGNVLEPYLIILHQHPIDSLARTIHDLALALTRSDEARNDNDGIRLEGCLYGVTNEDNAARRIRQE